MIIPTFARPRLVLAGRVGLACCALACSNDSQCLALPCPFPIAALISVTAANAPTGIVGVTGVVTGTLSEMTSCGQGAEPAVVCLISGGPGVYHVVLSASGYQSATLDFTVAGKAAGCNSCGEADTKHLTVVMLPA
jgi:hypothetical protein